MKGEASLRCDVHHAVEDQEGGVMARRGRGAGVSKIRGPNHRARGEVAVLDTVIIEDPRCSLRAANHSKCSRPNQREKLKALERRNNRATANLKVVTMDDFDDINFVWIITFQPFI